MQVQGPKAVDVIADLVGEEARTLPSFGLMEAQVGGRDVIISQTGFTGEKGYEIYLKEATKYAEDMWNAVLEAGVPYNLKVVAPSHHRRIAAGMGKTRLGEVAERMESGSPPYRTQLVGLLVGGKPITDYAPDFWLVSATAEGEPVGYVTSPWYSPELEANIAMAHVPVEASALGTEYWVHLPEPFADTPGVPVRAEVVEMPFRPSVNPNQRERLKMRGLDAAV